MLYGVFCVPTGSGRVSIIIYTLVDLSRIKNAFKTVYECVKNFINPAIQTLFY